MNKKPVAAARNGLLALAARVDKFSKKHPKCDRNGSCTEWVKKELSEGTRGSDPEKMHEIRKTLRNKLAGLKKAFGKPKSRQREFGELLEY